MPSLETATTEVRRRLGDPQVANLPDEQVEAALAAALREISRYQAEYEEVVMTVRVGVTDYDLPAGATGVFDFAFAPVGFAYQFPWEWEFLRFDTRFEYPSARFMTKTALEDRLTEYWRQDMRNNELPEWDLQVIQRADEVPVLRVHPTPPMDFKLGVLVEKLRSIESLDLRVYEHAITFAQGDCLEYIGRRRSKSVTQIPTATGALKLDDGRALRKEGRELKKDFHKAMGSGANVVYGG